MRFYIKQKVFSFKDKFYVMDESQKEMYNVEGKFFSISNKLQLLNMNGSQVLNANKKILAVFAKYNIYDPHGEHLAVVQRKFSIRPKFVVTVGNEELQVEGSLFAHSFGIMKDGREVATIQKRVISWGDTYEIDISDELNVELYLFIVIIIDQVIHEQKRINLSTFNQCKICGSNTIELVDTQLKVTYDICHNCDFISKQKEYHLNPDLEKARYSTHNNFPTNEGYVNIFKNMFEFHVRALKNVKNVLDFGSGPYPTLKLMFSELGYKAFDFDPFFNNNEDYKTRKYDLITSTEVIEHMSDPIQEINNLLELLSPQGYLLIMTNYRTMDLDTFLTWWYRRDDTHVAFFNLNTFDYIAKHFNLKIVSNNGKNIIVFQKQ